MNDRKNSPSNRQIIYLFLGFLILFILTFSLGVIVGKGLIRSKETYVAGEGKAPDVLSKKPTEPEKTPEIIKEKLSAEQSPAPLQRIEGTAESETAGIKEKQTPIPSPTEEPIKAETEKEEPTKKEFLVEQTPAPFKQVGEKAESEKIGIKKGQIPSPTREPIKIETGKKEEAAKKDIAAMPPIEPEGKYTVQIGSFQKQEEAKKILEAIKLKGYPAFIKKAEIPQKGTLYRVRIGTFKTREEAQIYGNRLKNSEPTIKSVFATVNN